MYQPSRRGAGQFGENLHRLLHVGALGRFVGLLVADPAQAVAGDLVAERLERRHRLRIALQRQRDAEHRQRQLALFKQAQNTPQSGARAVFVQRLHAHVAHRERLRADDLGQEGLRRRVAVQHAVFRAFLVVQHELQRHPCAARPLRMGRVAAVAGQVARIVGISVGHASPVGS